MTVFGHTTNAETRSSLTYLVTMTIGSLKLKPFERKKDHEEVYCSCFGDSYADCSVRSGDGRNYGNV